MSVSKLREFIEKPGCFQIGVAILFVLIMGSFVFSLRGNTAGMSSSNPEGGPQSPTLAMVGDFKVTQKAVDDMTAQTEQQYKQQGLTISPIFEARFEGNSISQQIDAGLLIQLAKQNNVDLSDNRIREISKEDLNRLIDDEKQKMIASSALPANATSKQIDDAFAKKYQRPLSTIIEENTKTIEDKLSSGDKGDIMSRAANTALMDYFENKITPTDDDLKRSEDTYVCKRIMLDTDKHKGEDLVKKAQSIIDEIKGGKINFLAAMEKYTDEAPSGKKKVSENTFETQRKTIDLDPDYAPIKDLKVKGDMTGPVTMSAGVWILQLQEIRPGSPPDFAKNKSTLLKNYKTDMAAKSLQAGLKALREKNIADWKSAGYKVLYEWSQFEQDPATFKLPPKEKNAKYSALAEEAKKATDADSLGTKAAVLTWYATESSVYGTLSKKEKDAAATDRMEVLKRVLDISGDMTARMEYVDLLAAAKDKTVGDQLALAANSLSTFDAPAVKTFGDIRAKFEKLKKDGLISADQEKQINDATDSWTSNKKEFDKQQQAANEERAKEEAEQKKKDEEAKKAQQKATIPGPVKPGTAPPVNSTPPPSPSSKKPGGK